MAAGSLQRALHPIACIAGRDTCNAMPICPRRLASALLLLLLTTACWPYWESWEQWQRRTDTSSMQHIAEVENVSLSLAGAHEVTAVHVAHPDTDLTDLANLTVSMLGPADAQWQSARIAGLSLEWAGGSWSGDALDPMTLQEPGGKYRAAISRPILVPLPFQEGLEVHVEGTIELQLDDGRTLSMPCSATFVGAAGVRRGIAWAT